MGEWGLEMDRAVGIWSMRLPEALGRGWLPTGPQARDPWA